MFGISPHKNVFAHLKVYGVCHDKYGEHDESVDVNNVDLVCKNIHLSNDVGKHRGTSSKTSTFKERLKVANTHIVPEVNKRRPTPATPKVSSVVHDVKEVNLCNSTMSKRPTKGIRVSHLNIQSLMSSLDEIKLWLKDNNFHVFTLSETWLDSSIHDSEINIPGYVVERSDRNRHGGDVAVYIKGDIHYKRRYDVENVNNIESVWLEIQQVHKKSIIIGFSFYWQVAKKMYLNS